MAVNRLQRSLRTTFIGMVTNVLLATGKTVAGVVGHSHALIADGVESFADLISSIIVWRGLVLAEAPADDDHPYGHGKAEPIAAAFVAAMLLIAAIWISVQSIREIITPHQLPASYTLWILIGVIGVKEFLFRFVLQESIQVESSAVKTDAWHHRADAITSFVAAIGIAIALIGGKGYEAADDYAALVGAAFIAWNGWKLLQPSLSELMDATPDVGLIEEIRKIAADVEDVEYVQKCLLRKMGYHFFVDMHVHVNPEMTVVKGHDVAHRVKDQIQARYPRVRDVLVHIEPAKILRSGT